MRTTKKWLLLGSVSAGLTLATACSKDPSELNRQWQARVTQLQKELLEARSLAETKALESKTLQNQLAKLQLKGTELESKLKACEAKLPLDAYIDEPPATPGSSKASGDKPAGTKAEPVGPPSGLIEPKGEPVGPPSGLIEPKVKPISPPTWLIPK